MNAPLYNPGIYHDTLWQFGVTILDRTTEEPVNISAMTIVVDVFDRPGEAAVFQFSGAGDADTGEVDMTGAGAGVFIVRATASQHAAVTPGGPYYWEARNVADALDPQYVANGTLYVGKAGERQTKWEVLNTYEGTFGQASLPGVIITVAGDVLVRDTLTALRAVNSGIARTTYVLGHTTAHDGGGGTFHWVAYSEEDDDDGLVVKPDDLEPEDPGRYVRAVEGHFNTNMWGHIDDDAAANQSESLQRAFDAASAHKRPLFHPEGRYLIGTTVRPASDLDWYGMGRATVLVRDPALSLSSQLFLNKNVHATTGERLDKNIRIRRLTFDGSLCEWPRWLQDAAGNTIDDPEADYEFPTGTLVSGLTLPTFTIVRSEGRIVSITPDTPGAGFATHPTFPYVAESVSLKITGGGGYGALASGIIDGDGIGSVTVLAGGRDYTSDPDIQVMGGYANPTILIDPSIDRRNPNFTTAGTCIALQKVDGYLIEECTFLDYGSMVVTDQGCKDGLVQNNTWERCCKDDGPFFCFWAQAFGNPLSPPINYQDTENVRVLNNNARDLERIFSLFAPTKGGIIAGNTIDGAKECGIFMPRAANLNGGRILVQGNLIKNVVVSDIVAAAFEIGAPAKNIFIIGNRLELCEGGVLTCAGCTNIHFYDNMVINCGVAAGELPYGPFSERVFFALGTEPRVGDTRAHDIFSFGYAASIAADNIRVRGNTIIENRAQPVFAVIEHVRSGETPPDPLSTNHYFHDNVLIIPPETEFVNDDFSDIFEPNGILMWNNPGSRWTGFMGRDDKFGNFLIDRLAGADGNSFLKHQLSPDSVLGMLAQLGLDEDLTLCLDAGDINSYDGSAQQWTDVSGASNHYNRGTTSGSDSTDPTFNGVAGRESRAEYFSVDGGDYFTPTAAHSFASTWHQAGAEFTLAVVYRIGTLGSSRRIFASIDDVLAGTGVMLHVTSELNVPQFAVFNAGATVAAYAVADVLTTADFNFAAVSVNEAGDFGDTFAMSGALINEYDPAYDTPAAGAADGVPNIFALTNGTAIMPSGSRVAAVLAWDRALTQAELSRVRNALSLRFPSI